MINNKLRIGNFTSSENVALLNMGSREMTEQELADHKKQFPKSKKKNIESWPGKAAITYIEETNMERRLGRSLTDEVNARPLIWGKLLESRVFDLLGLEYILTSQDTKIHPEIPYWAGSKDGIKMDEGVTVMDIKCPMTLKSFCQLVQPLYDGLTGMDAMNVIREKHKDGEKYYWQLVSNACIDGAQFAELIVYVPYLSELADIRLMAHNVPGDQASKHYWIAMANDDDLPYLLDEGYYKNINIIRFEVPEADKELLTQRVRQAGAMLINQPSIITALHAEVSATIIEP
jgi:hypothetical protein